jgi:uncharacterized membrane protein
MTGILLAPVGIGVWIVFIGLIVLMVRWTRPAARDSKGPALRLLEERYARGETTREDFLERRAVLRGVSPGASDDDPR